ncbi:MAG: TonB-dependent siderophore receptor [Rhodobacteraceae bacterium]|nr:TonB-dependent siderophore receptor [Paracoccaceae bacterium]MAY44363.1 TonB-dependent siderophore receptor [Paracoccaceae bacterium]
MTKPNAFRSADARPYLIALLLTSSALSPVVALAQEATELADITVEQSDEEGDGPVEGYVAENSVAGTKSDTPIAETPVSISVVGEDQVRDQDAQSVAEALRYTAGVTPEYRGTSNLHDEIMLRGFGNRTFVSKYLDGMNMGLSSLGQIDPYYLERIEVVKGPNSALYGQSTPGGFINQVSKRPTDEQGNEVVVGFGNDDYKRLSADLQGDLNEDGTLRYRLVGTAWQKNLQDELDQSRLMIAPSVTWDLSDRTELTLTGFYQNEPDAGQRGFLPLDGTLDPTSLGLTFPQDWVSYAPEYDSVTRETTAIGYQFQHRFDNGFTFHSKLRYTWLDATQDGAGLWSGTTTDGKTFPIYVFSTADDLEQLVTDNYITGEVMTGRVRHVLTGGIDFQTSSLHETYARSGGDLTFDLSTLQPVSLSDIYAQTLDAYTSDTTTDFTQTGIYVQDQMAIDNWRVTLGGRYDWTKTTIDDTSAFSGSSPTSSKDTYEDQAFTGRAAVGYVFPIGLMPYVSYSTSFEPVLDLDDDGKASFEPTHARQWELGAKWASNDGRFLVTAAYFDIEKTNLTESVFENGNYYTRQVGEVTSKGFELEGYANITDRLSMMASYSIVDPEVQTGDYAGKQYAFVPLDQAALWVKYGLIDGLDVMGGIRYVGKSWGDEENSIEVPSYTLFDVGLQASLGAFNPRMEGLIAQLNVTNLTDETYVTSCAFGRYCWYGEGRTVTASLSYEW